MCDHGRIMLKVWAVEGMIYGADLTQWTETA